jgi:hypothetical protein
MKDHADMSDENTFASGGSTSPTNRQRDLQRKKSRPQRKKLDDNNMIAEEEFQVS